MTTSSNDSRYQHAETRDLLRWLKDTQEPETVRAVLLVHRVTGRDLQDLCAQFQLDQPIDAAA